MGKALWRIVVALAAFSPAAGFAQEPLTLDAAVRAALARNAALRAARAGSDEASARSAEARSTLFPRVSVSESWQRGNQPVFVFSSLLAARQFEASNFAVSSLNHPDPTGLFRASIGVEQLLYDGGRRGAAAEEASLRRDAAMSSADEMAAAIVVATTQTFGRIAAATAACRAAAAGLAAAQEDLARAERRRTQGLVTDADVLALTVHTADLRQRGIQCEGDAAAASAELNHLIGNAIEADVRIVEPDPAADVAVEPTDVTTLLAEADRTRGEIARAAALERAAAAANRQSRAALLPQVAAQGAFDLTGTGFDSRASSWIVGGEVRWSFSTGGAELAARKAAAAAAARARAEAEAARGAVHVEVVTALRRVDAARAREVAGRTAVDQAREAQRIVRDRFDAGVAGVTDVLRASSAVLDAEANRASALVDRLSATAQLRRAIGRHP